MKNNISITSKPYKYLYFSEKTNSFFILAFLIPQIIMLFITSSWSSLILIASTTVASVIAEVIEILWKGRKSSFNYINAVIQGILTGLFLPSTFPFIPAFFISLIIILCCRFFIGGFADCWFNIPALTICICWILGAKLFPGYLITSDIILSKNPALQLIQNGTFPVLSADPKITATLNKTIFSLFGVSIPDGYVSLFWDTHSLIAAFRFNFITLVSSIVLLSLDVVKGTIPACFMVVYGLLVYFAGPYLYTATAVRGDLLLAFCTSGIFITVFFMLQYAGSTPLTKAGKIAYGVMAGIIAFFIAGAGTSPSGAAFTVIVMNIISPSIQSIEHFIEMKKVRNDLLDKVNELKEGSNA